jgi:tetratricopeptide (TPR) repeat protein
MRPKNMFINRSVVEDNDGRYIRIEQCLNETQGSLDVRGAMKILADGVDPLVGKVRGLGATVGMHTNMTSVVLDPSRAAVYVASGEAPSSRSNFVRLPLVGTFDPDDFPSLPLEFIPNTDFQSAHPEKHAAQQEFIKAKTAYEFQNDTVLARAHLEKATELDPGKTEYWYQLGIFAINNKDFARAREAFDSVFSCEYLPIQQRLLTHYWRGRLHAYHREYYEASVEFRKVITEPSIDIKLDAAARRALNRVVSRRRIGLGNIPLMMQQGDHLRY